MGISSDQVVMITGATDGLGKALAKRMAEQGVGLILHGRNPEKGEAVRDTLVRETGNKNVLYYNADFSSLREVRELADKLLSTHQRLDVLIHNAGIGPGKGNHRQTSEDGYELRFAVNYLAVFLLTDLLLPLLKVAENPRIVMVSSGLQEAIDFSDLMLEYSYTGRRAYAQSKLALVMLTFTLAERLQNTGIHINAIHPASLMDTQLVRESHSVPRSSVAEGVDAVWFVAAAPETAGVSGAFFDGKQQAKAHQQAYNREVRELLFTNSLRLTDL